MTTQPPPIRVGLIGLSASAATAWAANAHLPYLLSPTGRSRYTITALLNSSTSAAERAVAAYNLHPSQIKTYGDPAALAADPSVDLVVCNTRVDTHFDTVLPSVKAGKDVFVEWPLAHDTHHARVLAEEIKKAGGRGIVGLQGGVAPVAAKLRQLLEEGRIGKVLSSELRVFGGTNDRAELPDKLAYFAERKYGGNIVAIGVMHTLHLVQSVLGDLASAKADLHLQRPEIPIRDTSSNTITRTIQSEIPDLILVSGRWDESSITQKNATLHYRTRRGQPFSGEPALQWTIHGEKGEIRIVSRDMGFIHVGNPSARVIEIHDFATNTVDKVEWDWEKWQQELPVPARNIGSLYEAFVEAKKSGTPPRYVTFDDAVRRHEQLDGLFADWKP